MGKPKGSWHLIYSRKSNNGVVYKSEVRILLDATKQRKALIEGKERFSKISAHEKASLWDGHGDVNIAYLVPLVDDIKK